MDCSVLDSPALHFLPAFAQIHVHRVSSPTDLDSWTQLSRFPCNKSSVEPSNWMAPYHGTSFMPMRLALQRSCDSGLWIHRFCPLAPRFHVIFSLSFNSYCFTVSWQWSWCLHLWFKTQASWKSSKSIWTSVSISSSWFWFFLCTYFLRISFSMKTSVQFSLVQSLSCVRLFATPWPQHPRPPCLSPTPGVHPNPCPLSQWCHPAISSSVVPFSSCLQSFPASGSFPVSQLFTSVGQSIGVSASTSVLPMNTQDWSLLGWTGWLSLQSRGLSRVFSNTTVQKHQFFCAQLSF